MLRGKNCSINLTWEDVKTVNYQSTPHNRGIGSTSLGWDSQIYSLASQISLVLNLVAPQSYPNVFLKMSLSAFYSENLVKVDMRYHRLF